MKKIYTFRCKKCHAIYHTRIEPKYICKLCPNGCGETVELVKNKEADRNKMREKGDWEKFISFADRQIKEIPYQHSYPRTSAYLFGSPANFFKLMEEWLKDR